MAEVIRLKRDQLEAFITDFETLQQFELMFETLDTINSTTVVGLRADIDTNTVNIGVNAGNIANNDADILALQNDKADLLNPTFTDGVTVTNNIIVGGTVDGRDIAVDGTKLDTIETGATGDQTGAEIKALYEAEPDTNAFTDADETKLDGIEALADVTDQTNVNAALGTTDAPAVTDTGTVGDAGKLVKLDGSGNLDGRNIDVDGTKLDTIESGATGDQTAGEIKIAYESNADTNAFTDADESKLDGIASGAQVNTVDSVAGKTGVVTLVKGDVGLGSVDNTSDADKPVSTAQQTALDGKEDTFTKNTAFNKDFGTLGTEVCVGNDARLSDSRTCDNTFDNAATSRTALDVYSTTEVDTSLDSKFDDFVKDSQVPTTGFSITLTQNGSNHWLILNPAGSLASGTITLVAPGSATDLQEIMISTTKQITSITIAGNGATAVYGAPSVLAAGSTYKLKYDSALTSWFVFKP